MTDAPPVKRLLAINNYFYRRGGAEAIFLDHIEMFSSEGWDAIPFAMQHPDNKPSPWNTYFVSEIEYGRQPGLLTKLRHAADVIYSREAQRNITALIRQTRPAIAHAHNVYHHISPSIFSTLREAGIPTVMTVHDLKIACPAYKMLSKGKVCEKCRGGRIHNVVTNRCVKDSLAVSSVVFAETLVHRMLGLYTKKVDRLVVPSRFYRDKLVEWGWPPEQLVYIPNFVDDNLMAETADEGDYFLFIGRLAPEKGLETLLRASVLSGTKLVIAGSGPQEQTLRSLADGLKADVTFTGHLSGQQLHGLIASAKALVLPSEWYENAPVSILEAYAFGRPVIGARIGGIPELIVDDVTGMTAMPADPEDLARTLTAMAALPASRRAEMGQAGRAWIASDFSKARYRDRMLSLYGTLIG